MTVFIIEGLPGSGKTTLIKKLRKLKNLVFVKEVAEELAGLGYGVGHEVSLKQEKKILKIHLSKLKKALKVKDTHVVMDRSYISSLVHSMADYSTNPTGELKKKLESIQKIIPDCVDVRFIFLKVNPKLAYQRTYRRKNNETLSKRKLDYFKSMNAAYKKILKNPIVIDASKGIHDVLEKTIESIFLRPSQKQLRPSLAKAYRFSKKNYAPIKRLSGEPYFAHPLAIVRGLLRLGITNKDAISAALMHDLIEDTNVTKEDIEKKFNKRTANMVDALTKNGDDLDSELEYFKQIENSSYEVKIIKFLDIMDNLSSLDALSKNAQERFIIRTKRLYLPLARKTNRRLYKKIKSQLKSRRPFRNVYHARTVFRTRVSA